MISAKLKHSTDRCLLTVASLFQAVLWDAVAILQLLQAFGKSTPFIFAVAWTASSVVFAITLFKHGGPKCNKICCTLVTMGNMVTVIPSAVLSIGSALVAVSYILKWQFESSVAGGFDYEKFSLATLVGYICVFIYMSFGLICRAALKHNTYTH